MATVDDWSADLDIAASRKRIYPSQSIHRIHAAAAAAAAASGSDADDAATCRGLWQHWGVAVAEGVLSEKHTWRLALTDGTNLQLVCRQRTCLDSK